MFKGFRLSKTDRAQRGRHNILLKQVFFEWQDIIANLPNKMLDLIRNICRPD